MNYKIKAFGALCHLEKFEINGITAEEEDFVDKYDHRPEDAKEYGCGDMAADIIEPTEEVLEKYFITREEFAKIAEITAEKLSFGYCEWCV